MQTVAALEDKYRDHELRFARRSDRYLDAEEARSYLNGALGHATGLADSAMRLLTPSAQESAFGKPGDPGDADRIMHLAKRIGTVYEEFMDWAADFRGAAVPAEYQTAFELAARLVDEPVEEFRQFVFDVRDEVDKLPEWLATPEPREQRTIEITLVLTVSDEAVEAFNREIRRLGRRLQ